MNIAHITQRLAGCHGTGCATHQGKACDCGAAERATEKYEATFGKSHAFAYARKVAASQPCNAVAKSSKAVPNDLEQPMGYKTPAEQRCYSRGYASGRKKGREEGVLIAHAALKNDNAVDDALAKVGELGTVGAMKWLAEHLRGRLVATSAAHKEE